MLLLPSKETAALPRLSRLGCRRLTRAHVLLAERSQIVAAAQSAASAIASALTEQLGAPVAVTASLVDCAVSLGRAFPRASAFALLDLSAVGVHAVVEVEPVFLSGVLDKLCGGRAKGGPVTELTRIETVAFGYLCGVALSGIAKQPLLDKRFAPRLIAVHQRREEFIDRLSSERHVCIDARVEVGELSGAVRLLLPATAVQTAIAELPSTRPSTVETKVSNLAVTFRARMGKAQLSAKEIVDLERGDVLVLDGMTLANGQLAGALRLTGTHAELVGELTPDGFQLSRALLRRPITEVPMKTDEATCTLPIELEVELARVQIPVGELAILRPGAVVPLRINPADPVVIRVGDRVLAKAELVEIDGEVGARILSIVG